MSDIFQEVDEDLRRERALKFWQRYGNFVIAGAVLIVAGTAGYTFWKDYTRKQAEAGAVQFIAAVEQARAGDANAAPALASVANEAPAGYAALARLQEAALKLRSGDAAGAVTLYRAIAADGSVERELRDAAAVLAAVAAVNSADAAELERQVSAIAAANSPWRHLVWEISALAAAKAGNTEQARSFYTRITDDPAAPAAMRSRAAEMLAALGG